MWIKRMEGYHFQHRSPPGPALPPSSPPAMPMVTLEEIASSTRGRDLRSTASSRVRSNVRTPPRKPPAWRRPSADLWPVLEESESLDKVGLGIRV